MDEQDHHDQSHHSESVHLAVTSLHQLSALETETLAAEIHLLGQLRDRISPAARFADKIQIKYRRLNRDTLSEAEQAEYLLEGFPFVDRGKPLAGLLVIDKYSAVGLDPTDKTISLSGQYFGERLYLTHDRKWILAERVGTYSETKGATSEWEASCRIVTDRSLLERYSVDAITEGLFAATNKLWGKLSPRMEAVKKRSEKAQRVSASLAKLGPMRFSTSIKPESQQKPTEEDPARPLSKIAMIGNL